MKRRHPLLLTLALAASGLSVSAQTMKPGLWEMKNKMTTSSGEMEKAMALAQKEMAKMPADQRKMMEDMMAKNGVALGAKPNSVRVCITPEMASRHEVPQKEGSKCTHKTLQQSGNKVKYSFSCEGNPPTTGEGEYTLAADSKSYTGVNIVNTTVQGKPERMEMTVTGTFVAADCGALKPVK